MSPPAATSSAETLAAADSAADVNPYAASAVAEPLVPSADVLGIGVWRDGDYLVMHQMAPLPRVCLFTGLPATHGRLVTLSWYYRLLSSQSLQLVIPLSERWIWLDRCRWSLGLVAGLGAAGGSAALIALTRGAGRGQTHDTLEMGLFALIAIGVVAALYIQNTQRGCGIAQVRGDYLWIGGPSRAFLAQLPPWPAEEA